MRLELNTEQMRQTKDCRALTLSVGVNRIGLIFGFVPRHFGPISGYDSKLENPKERYLVTTFFCHPMENVPAYR